MKAETLQKFRTALYEAAQRNATTAEIAESKGQESNAAYFKGIAQGLRTAAAALVIWEEADPCN